MADIRNRIVEHRKVRLGDIKINPANYKVHTEAQRNAINAATREIGWIGVPLVYKSERNGGVLTYVDGNMRGAQYPDMETEVAITDLTDAEADYALLTYDPLAQMAGIAVEKMDEVLRSIKSNEAVIQELLSRQAADAGLYFHPEGDDTPYKELDKELEDLAGAESVNITIIVPSEHVQIVKQWLANGEPATGPGMGKGVLRHCGLIK